MQKGCPQPTAEPDQTRVVLVPLLAVDGCDVQRCSSVCTGTGLSDFREQQMPSKPDPVLALSPTLISFAFESPPPADVRLVHLAGVHPHLQTVVLRC
jgi:hypothetical protein